jgi:hypothetical protein
VLCPFDRAKGVANPKLVEHDGFQEQLPPLNIATATATLNINFAIIRIDLNMTCIEISDLTTADSKSLADADSFLNELGKTETTQIFGGSYDKCWSYWEKDDYSKDEYCYEKEDDYCYKEEKKDYNYKEEKKDYSYSYGWEKWC